MCISRCFRYDIDTRVISRQRSFRCLRIIVGHVFRGCRRGETNARYKNEGGSVASDSIAVHKQRLRLFEQRLPKRVIKII
jgi:hypothetical protein